MKRIKSDTKKEIMNTLVFFFGVFLLALNYNLFLAPHNLVVSGMSGLAIICNKLFNWNATAFIYISSLLLLIVSYIFLGKRETSHTVIGSILYPIMISATQPISNYILLKSDLTEYIVIVCLASCAYGIASGLVYKSGYTTGGGDVIMQLLSKYCNISTSNANFVYSILIIALSGAVFGISSFIYSLIILVISNLLINKIIIGISNSKVFFICTHKKEEIKSLIKNNYLSNYTILNSKNGLFQKHKDVIMVVIPSRVYHAFKNEILNIDPDAFFIINDCYEVKGGVKGENIPYF